MNHGKSLGWAGYASIIRELQLGPLTAPLLSDKFGLQRQFANRLLQRLADLGMAHVSSWVQPVRHSVLIAQYAYGPGESMPSPYKPGQRLGRVRLTRFNSLPELVHVVHMLRVMEAEPIAKDDLASAVGSQPSNVSRFVNHCHAIGLAHIAEWRARRGRPAAMFAFGHGQDDQRPKTISKSEISRRYRKARREKDHMLRVLYAVAAPSTDRIALEAA